MPELLLPRLKREIEARLAELRPVLAEVEQLQAAKRALLAERERAERAPVGGAGRRAQAPSSILPPLEQLAAQAPSVPRDRPAADEDGGSGDPQRDAIVAIVEERPGVSVAEIVAVTKIDKAAVGALVARLEREGLFTKEFGGLKLASRQPMTLEQIAAAAAARGDGASDEEGEAARPEAARGA